MSNSRKPDAQHLPGQFFPFKPTPTRVQNDKTGVPVKKEKKELDKPEKPCYNILHSEFVMTNELEISEALPPTGNRPMVAWPEPKPVPIPRSQK